MSRRRVVYRTCANPSAPGSLGLRASVKDLLIVGELREPLRSTGQQIQVYDIFSQGQQIHNEWHMVFRNAEAVEFRTFYDAWRRPGAFSSSKVWFGRYLMTQALIPVLTRVLAMPAEITSPTSPDTFRNPCTFVFMVFRRLT